MFHEEEWKNFCEVLGSPEWTNEPKFATLSARKENEDELDRLIEAWTILHPAEEVMQMMQARGVPAGVLQTGRDLLEIDPQLKHRQMVIELDHPERGSVKQVGIAIKLSETPGSVRSLSPETGEHTKEILLDLGYDLEAIQQFSKQGIVSTV